MSTDEEMKGDSEFGGLSWKLNTSNETQEGVITYVNF